MQYAEHERREAGTRYSRVCKLISIKEQKEGNWTKMEEHHSDKKKFMNQIVFYSRLIGKTKIEMIRAARIIQKTVEHAEAT
jgi:hypothetical protein